MSSDVQAFVARLALAPPNGRWSEAACQRLLDLTRPACNLAGPQRGLVARLQTPPSPDHPLHISLFDTVTNDMAEGINIGEVLVKEGLALKRLDENTINYEASEASAMIDARRETSNLMPDVGAGDSASVCRPGRKLSVSEIYQSTAGSSTCSEELSLKSQLKKLLHTQNMIHSIVCQKFGGSRSENVNSILNIMSKSQEDYQTALARLLSSVASSQSASEAAAVSVGSSEVKVVKPKFKSRDSVSSRFHGTKKLNAVEQVGSQLAETVALTETDMDIEKVVQVEGVEQEFIRCEDLTTSQAKLAVAEPGPGREAPGQQMCETVVAGGGSPRVLELQLGGVLVHPVLLAGEWLLTAAEISRLVPRWHGYNLLVSFLAR